MSARTTFADNDLTAVRTVGAALPADVLARVVDPKGGLPGIAADDYELEIGVTPVEAANRAWSVLTGAWVGYRAARDRLPEADRATSLTRDKWLLVLLRELGFGRVPTSPTGGINAGNRSFPVSHLAGPVPVHLLGRGVPLDSKTPGLAGAAERAPHAMVQELLNRSDEHLWAIVGNDTTLRLLRDSSTLVGQSYVEFDLAAIFEGELFADFTVLYLLCHHSRFQPTDDAGLAGCWLERWRTHAAETGARALGALRDGVKDAIESLGTGFLRHPANGDLRDRLTDGTLDLADVHRSLLRLVYRLLFLFVAEDRGLLLDPAASEAAKARYRDWFSTGRLRHVARRRRGTRHDDQWQALRIVLDGLGHEAGRPELGLPALGGIFENGPADVTATCALANEHLLAAVRHLSIIQPPEGGPRRTVDYRNLGAEELGGIYESLLEFVPRHDPSQRSLTLETLAGNDRKTSGAYYTPTSLIDCLLDSALDPLLDRAEGEPEPEAVLLALTVCDPACGSGHFLVAAAKRIAHRVARVRAEGAEPTIDQSQAAMHDVVARCIYGVDLNPMAAELAKVSLWLESLAAGRPLGFLDAHIKIGNALLGTTPALLADGIPDEAFMVLEGDDKKVVSSLKKQNKQERAGQGDLFASSGIPVDNGVFADAARKVDALAGLSLADVHLARQRQRDLDASPEFRRARLLADTWCAAFVAPRSAGEPIITHALLEAWAQRDVSADDPTRAAVERLAAEYRFFHWHLEFPQIFGAKPAADGPGWQGGFACVLGNPPWERVKLQEQEFFASRNPEVAGAPNAAARKRLIRALQERDPLLFTAFGEAKRRAEGESHLLRSSGRYPLNGRGDINTYAVFAEHDRTILGSTGRLGVILPTGIATDATTQHYFKDLVQRRSLASLYDFENATPLFEGVHRSFKFCLLTLSGAASPVEIADFAFFARHPADLARDGVRFPLTPEEIHLLNPNTSTCPVFRSRRDAELTLAIYRRVPVLVKHDDPGGNPWGVSFLRMIDMSNDSHLFHAAADLEGDGWSLDGNRYRNGQEEMLALYQGVMVSHFDHRAADVVRSASAQVRQNQPSEVSTAEKCDPARLALPISWVDRSTVLSALDNRWTRGWLPVFRDITSPTNERTFVGTVIPLAAVGNKLPLVLPDTPDGGLLTTVLSSFAFDYCSRQKLGGVTLNYFIVEQLPAVPPRDLTYPAAWDQGRAIRTWLSPRTLELTYTSWDMQPFAHDLGDTGPPFRWDEERRAVLRAELDAACFHLYGIDNRDDVDYILGTFPIVNRKDVAKYGEELTRRLVLENYDAMAVAARTGVPFVSLLDPAPGHGPRHEQRSAG